MIIEFEERQLLGTWSIEVKRGRSVVGRIRRRPDTGAYRYFDGPHNEQAASDEDANLDALKQRIAAKAGAARSKTPRRLGPSRERF